jgi:DNA repair exonuclease SbcCD ATPase subunit
MIKGLVQPRSWGVVSYRTHNEFLELCAVSTSGQLTEEEQKKLQEHLAVCESCQETVKQYESVVDQAIPAFVAKEAWNGLDAGQDWSEDQQRQAEQVLFKRLDRESKRSTSTNEVSTIPRRLPPFSSESTWCHVWMLYAAGILLFVSLSLCAYRTGVHRGIDTSKVTPPSPNAQSQSTLAAQSSDAGHERQITRTQIEQRDKTIGDLRQQLAQRMAEINTLKAAQDRLENDLRASDAGKHDLGEQRAELAQKLDAALSASQELQQKLDSLAQQSAQDIARAKTLDARVDDLNRLLRDREVALDQKDELLAHDRDIRDLMGARDLYIAEVYDVARTGETQKAYGRVFYTRGKSLIFYAYDLDQQTATKTANAFQAWGRRGPDQQKALNLGVFYEDNASKKRWILKCDDPKTLAQIDGVFVTVEPDGGSQKPSGKSLLFAYLRADPNHP